MAKFEKVLLWSIFITMALTLACVSVVWPLAYCWFMGTVGSAVILMGGMVLVGSLASSGSMFDAIIAFHVMKAVFEVIGAIFSGLANASKS